MSSSEKQPDPDFPPPSFEPRTADTAAAFLRSCNHSHSHTHDIDQDQLERGESFYRFGQDVGHFIWGVLSTGLPMAVALNQGAILVATFVDDDDLSLEPGQGQ